MKLSQKRTCNRCKAVIYDKQNPATVGCALHHKQTTGTLHGGYCAMGYPLEPCLKPSTITELKELISKQHPSK